MSSTADKALIKRLFEAINANEFDALEPHPGFWETRQVVPPAHRSFRDWRTLHFQPIAEQGKVFSSLAVDMLHYGPFAGLVPTNRRITLVGFSLDQVQDGVVVEHNSTMSWPSALREIGATGLDGWPDKLPHVLRLEETTQAPAAALARNKAAVADMLDALCRGKPGIAGHHRGVLETIHEFAAIRRAFPDLEYELLMQVSEGNMVGTRAVLHGTHAGPLRHLPASNRTIEWDYFSFARVINGNVVEHTGTADWSTALIKLGAMALG